MCVCRPKLAELSRIWRFTNPSKKAKLRRTGWPRCWNRKDLAELSGNARVPFEARELTVRYLLALEESDSIIFPIAADEEGYGL